MATHANRVQMTVSSVASSGLGTITLGSASSGYRTLASAYGADATVDVLITEGTSWEVARGCAYTNSGTTLSRGTLESSSTGSAVAFTSAAIVSVILPASTGNSLQEVMKTYIIGLLVTKGTGNTINISAGACYDPSSGKVISYAGGTDLSAGTLGASQWHQVYLYDSAGTATVQVSNNAAPPSSTYAGTARQGGTNSNRRWIGCFYTNASSNIVATSAVQTANGYRAFFASSRMLNGGTSTTYGSIVSYATTCPSYVTASVYGQVLFTAAAGGSSLTVSLDGSSDLIAFTGPGFSTPAGFFMHALDSVPVGYSSGTPGHYYKMSSASIAGYIDISGYEVTR